MAYNLLKGKSGIIFGALEENSIAWKTALKVKEEGGELTLTNAPIALRLGKINELAAICNSQVIPADATTEQDLNNLVTKSVEIPGGNVDFNPAKAPASAREGHMATSTMNGTLKRSISPRFHLYANEISNRVIVP
jgi:enoyl-[acyl-carrier-protein] reductase (NADH)